MWTKKITELATNYDGTIDNLPKFSSVGCYPLFYLDQHDNVLCPNCANEYREDDDYAVVTECAPNWEDSDLYCDQCSSRIESAYAE